MQENPCLRPNSDLSYAFDEMIKNCEKSRKNPFSGEIFYSRHLTQCERRILYRVYGIEEEKQCMWQEFSERYTKAKWLKILDSVYALEIVDKNFKAADAYYNLTANVDCIARIYDKPVVVLIRGLSDEDYNDFKDDMDRSTLVDIEMQMWLLEIANGLIITENRSTLEHMALHVVPYNPVISSCKNKCLKLVELKMYGKMPERPYNTSDSKECSICEFHKTCWNKKENAHE